MASRLSIRLSPDAQAVVADWVAQGWAHDD